MRHHKLTIISKLIIILSIFVCVTIIGGIVLGSLLGGCDQPTEPTGPSSDDVIGTWKYQYISTNYLFHQVTWLEPNGKYSHVFSYTFPDTTTGWFHTEPDTSFREPGTYQFRDSINPTYLCEIIFTPDADPLMWYAKNVEYKTHDHIILGGRNMTRIR